MATKEFSVGDTLPDSAYTELRSNAEIEYYHHFQYDEDLAIGQLVRISADYTVSAVAASSGAVNWVDAIGVCMQNKVNSWNNRNGDDLVDVRLFAPLTRLSTIQVGSVSHTAGDLIALATGMKAICLEGGSTGDVIHILTY